LSQLWGIKGPLNQSLVKVPAIARPTPGLGWSPVADPGFDLRSASGVDGKHYVEKANPKWFLSAKTTKTTWLNQWPYSLASQIESNKSRYTASYTKEYNFNVNVIDSPVLQDFERGGYQPHQHSFLQILVHVLIF